MAQRGKEMSVIIHRLLYTDFSHQPWRSMFQKPRASSCRNSTASSWSSEEMWRWRERDGWGRTGCWERSAPMMPKDWHTERKSNAPERREQNEYLDSVGHRDGGRFHRKRPDLRPVHTGTNIGVRYSPAFFVFTPKRFSLTMSRVNMQIHSLTLDGA